MMEVKRRASICEVGETKSRKGKRGVMHKPCTLMGRNHHEYFVTIMFTTTNADGVHKGSIGIHSYNSRDSSNSKWHYQL